jgi:hypothetical protein
MSMKLFNCQACAQLLYFENTLCEKCSHRLGYLPGINALSALEPQDGGWRALAADSRSYRNCANAEFDVCNWLVEAGAPEPSGAPDRTMGQPDVYPFVLSLPVIGKLNFIHSLVHGAV